MSTKPTYQRFVIVKDDFYQDPQKVYQEAMAANYYEPRYYTGPRSRNVYHEPGIKSRLEGILGIKITRWDTDPSRENGVFYGGYAKGKNKETPGVHSDFPYDDITVLIYLTPGLPFDCGTSFWMHRKTQLTDPPTAGDARRLKVNVRDLRERFERETTQRDKWVEIDRIGNRFNRMLAFPSGVLHSATRHYGATIKDVRLYQTFRIGVDWRSFRMAKS